MVRFRSPVVLLLLVMVAPMVLLTGCDEDIKTIPGPPNNQGLFPLRVGNTWKYDVNRTVIDCTGHPLVDCRYEECVADCNAILFDCNDFCWTKYQQCLSEGTPLDVCRADYLRCLDDCDADKNQCLVDSDCARFYRDPNGTVCAEQTCYFMDEDGNNQPGEALCFGVPTTYDKCNHRRQIRFFTDTISSLTEINGDLYYTFNGDQYRWNKPGGTYYYGSRGSVPYENEILEFAYPAPEGYFYEVNYEERGVYDVTIMGINVPIAPEFDQSGNVVANGDLLQAYLQNNSQPFYCYHYQFVKKNTDDCGCQEVFNYYISPGVGIILVEAKFGEGRDGQFVRSYRQTLQSYDVMPLTFGD